MVHTIHDIIKDIEKRKNRGYGLDHFKEYMVTIHNPHVELKSIHIAGTNGKGSTVNYIRSILQEAGYKVGTFTSPYLITHLDRIRINDNNIKEEDFLKICNMYYDSWNAWDLSMFEIDMVIACLYFKQQKVDFCIFEVGLGGRLDSTNILKPLVSVITNIGMDHMELLGDTYEKIANEKAGIIKPNVDVITAEKKIECLSVFQKHCTTCNVKLYQITDIMNLHTTPELCFDYKHWKNIHLSTQAKYQVSNTALALEVIHHLKVNKELKIEDKQIYQGLLKSVWFGRFEIIHEHPLIILDGAHNVDGIQALANSLENRNDVSIIFSVLRDKNFEGMLDILEDVSKDITICHFENERALDIQVLKNRPHIQLIENYKQAIKKAILTKKCIVITGSLYFISEVRKYILNHLKNT